MGIRADRLKASDTRTLHGELHWRDVPERMQCQLAAIMHRDVWRTKHRDIWSTAAVRSLTYQSPVDVISSRHYTWLYRRTDEVHSTFESALSAVLELAVDLLTSSASGEHSSEHFLLRDARIAIVCRPSVRPSVDLSVCDVDVSWAHRLDKFEINYTNN